MRRGDDPRRLRRSGTTRLFEETLEEENVTGFNLTAIAENSVNDAAAGGSDEEDSEEDEPQPARGAATRTRATAAERNR